MPILSRTTLIYAPGRDPCEEIPLVAYRDILMDPIRRDGSTGILRTSVINADWIRQASTGNASLSLSCTRVSNHATQAEAERYGQLLQMRLLTRPVGTLTEMTAYDHDLPTLIIRWTSSIDQCDPQPLSSDIWFGMVPDDSNGEDILKMAWQATSYKFTLTDPVIL